MDQDRPGTSSGRPTSSQGGRPGTSQSLRPPTSSGSQAPAFGTAHTPNAPSAASRPNTRGQRAPGSRAGTAASFQGLELNPYGMEQVWEEDEWDDESEDGDVFAFKPRK